jgi:hypothetical protein
MANRLANTANLFLVCIFYAPLIPLAPFLAFLGMLFGYCVDKYLLLRRHERPEEMSGMMVHFFANLLPFMAFIWALSNYLYTRRIFNEYNDGFF